MAAFSFPNTIGWGGDFDVASASKILWNFEGLGGNLTLQNQFYGSILAPQATLKNTSAIDGSVWVQTINAQGEIHYSDSSDGVTSVVQYDGYTPPSSIIGVPEPSTMVIASFSALHRGALLPIP